MALGLLDTGKIVIGITLPMVMFIVKCRPLQKSSPGLFSAIQSYNQYIIIQRCCICKGPSTNDVSSEGGGRGSLTKLSTMMPLEKKSQSLEKPLLRSGLHFLGLKFQLINKV